MKRAEWVGEVCAHHRGCVPAGVEGRGPAPQTSVSPPGNAAAPTHPGTAPHGPGPHLGVGGQQLQVAVVALPQRLHLAAQLPLHRVPVEDAQAQLLCQGEERLSLRGQHLQGLGAAP